MLRGAWNVAPLCTETLATGKPASKTFEISDVYFGVAGADGNGGVIQAACDDALLALAAGKGTGGTMFVCDVPASGSDKDVIVSIPAGSFTDAAGNWCAVASSWSHTSLSRTLCCSLAAGTLRLQNT